VLEMWLKWLNACLPCSRSWIQSPVLRGEGELYFSWLWWHRAVIPELGGWGRKISSSRSAWVTLQVSVSKQIK
jgi:hypothetical protein